MIEFGPQIAIVEDNLEEVKEIREFFALQNIGYKLFDADITQNNKPAKPIETIELIFLDLYYLPEFDPYLCADWVNSIVAENKLYELVIWSKDSHKSEDLRNVLLEINKAPRALITKQKSDYQIENGTQILLQEIEFDINKISKIFVDEFIAEIIDISEDYVILNCLLDKEKGYYQIRKFEKTPLLHFYKLESGRTLIVKSTTSLGQRSFEFIELFEDNSKLFEQKNIFLKLKNTPFLNNGKL